MKSEEWRVEIENAKEAGGVAVMDECRICGRPYERKTVTQRYCSRRCRQKACDRGLTQRESIVFQCAKCGKTVVTESERRDMRTRFCSQVCEKKYWRHPPYANEAARQNFHSLREYQSYERRTNEE